MHTVKQIELLPVNSYELDTYLSELGLSLRKFAADYDFTRKCFDIDDCDFIQSVLIEFVYSLKPYFIPFLAVARCGYAKGDLVEIHSENHTAGFITETAANARELGLRLSPSQFSEYFYWEFYVREKFQDLLKSAFLLKTRFRYSRIGRNSLPQPKSGQFRLLLTTYQPNTVFTLTPVQDALSNRDDIFQLYIANRLETYDKLKKLGYENVVNGWALSSEKKLRFRDSVFDDFVEQYFLTRFPVDPATKRFKGKFKKSLKSTLLFAARLYPAMKDIISNYRPDTLLMSSSSTTDAQILIHLARNRNTRVVEMTHGMFQDTPLLKFQNIPTKLVWSDHQKELMRKYNPSIDCPVVGNPKQDGLIEKFNKSEPARCIPEKYVLFVSSPGRNTSLSWPTYLKVLKDYIEVAKATPNLHFILKLHPSENIRTIQTKAEELKAPINFLISKGTDVYQLLFHAEIVVVITSSVGFEALLWKKKIICFEVPNSDKWIPFGEFGLAKKAGNPDQLINAIDFFLNNGDLVKNNLNAGYFSFSDGRALQRILEISLHNDS